MSYETALEDYLTGGYLAGQIDTVEATVTGTLCTLVLTYSGCHALDDVALAAAVGVCHELPEAGSYTLTVEQTPDALYSVTYDYDWAGVSGTIENVVKVA